MSLHYQDLTFATCPCLREARMELHLGGLPQTRPNQAEPVLERQGVYGLTRFITVVFPG